MAYNEVVGTLVITTEKLAVGVSIIEQLLLAL